MNEMAFISDINGNGFTGEIAPHLLQSNEWITATLLGCFLITSYVLSRGKGYLLQRLNSFFATRSRHNVFNERTTFDAHCQLLLFLQTCVLIAILLLSYHAKQIPLAKHNVPILLGSYTGLTLLFFLVKWWLYKFINWIYFDKVKNVAWEDFYTLLITLSGILLLPATLCTIYFSWPVAWSSIFYLLLFILINFLMLYKGFCIFFNHLHGTLFLFLYFCTLEILPFLVVWKGLKLVNGIFI